MAERSSVARWLIWMSIPEAIVIAVVLIAAVDMSAVLAVAIAVAYVAMTIGLASWITRISAAQKRRQDLEASGLDPDEVPESMR